ncbi:MAG TPA: hypothetical protein GX513_13160, partial [Firmicutes bacterium]|nr:hypothetical protein [Bacillota bacterium]
MEDSHPAQTADTCRQWEDTAGRWAAGYAVIFAGGPVGTRERAALADILTVQGRPAW